MKVLREPLVHFLLLGAGLFALSSVLDKSKDGSKEIVVGEAEIASRLESWRILWQRPPTKEELDELVEDYVREEVLYREAIAMGLDEGDSVVRQRLRQKMEWLAEEENAPPEPTDEELREFLSERADSFQREGRVPELEEVRERLVREWIAARKAEARDAFYRGLREKYEVRIELPGIDPEDAK